MRISNIKTEESEPRLSAYDPHCPTSFGNISFLLCDKKVEASLADRYADYILVNVGSRVARYRLTNPMRLEFKELTEKLWNQCEADLKLPMWLEEIVKEASN